jgi:hypothetical protein
MLMLLHDGAVPVAHSQGDRKGKLSGGETAHEIRRGNLIDVADHDDITRFPVEPAGEEIPQLILPFQREPGQLIRFHLNVIPPALPRQEPAVGALPEIQRFRVAFVVSGGFGYDMGDFRDVLKFPEPFLQQIQLARQDNAIEYPHPVPPEGKVVITYVLTCDGCGVKDENPGDIWLLPAGWYILTVKRQGYNDLDVAFCPGCWKDKTCAEAFARVPWRHR